MSPYVILRKHDRKYVAPASSDSAYARDLAAALFFLELEQALAACGDGEVVVSIKDLVRFK